MRKVLKDFYYGNIRPFEQKMTVSSDLRRAVNTVTRCESQLAEQLGKTERLLLTKLIEAQQDIDCITSAENFILGFRLGVRLMAECMDEDDGELTEVTSHG